MNFHVFLSVVVWHFAFFITAYAQHEYIHEYLPNFDSVEKIKSFFHIPRPIVTDALKLRIRGFQKHKLHCPSQQNIEDIALECFDGKEQNSEVISCIVCNPLLHRYRYCEEPVPKVLMYCQVCDSLEARENFHVLCGWCESNLSFKTFYRLYKLSHLC